MSDARKAVFLSYASQDADAARRICEALRAAGVEVWFDQSELRGGDAWDQKIRKQIKDCALFVPIISANTQARQEGYFRLEWKLAEDRSHLMAKGNPFIVPVTVDGTQERSALVPDAFLAVQWTRLSGGEASVAFVTRMQKLSGMPGSPVSPAISFTAPPGGVAPASKSGPLLWAVVALGAAVLALAAFVVMRPHGQGVAPVTKPASKPTDTSAAAITDKSIAVLPFANRSTDKETNAVFTDGIHEDILTNLGHIRELRVVSRTSVEQYRATTKSTPEIARELGVAFILEGSVQRDGNKVRVTGQLIRAATDEHVWANNYDRNLTDIFAIQSELAQAIAGELKTAISPQEKNILEHRPTVSTAAYDLYLAARANATKLKFAALLARQEELLQRAVALDPNFAEAWGELAVVHANYVRGGWDESPERLAKADAAIGQAVRLAPDSPEVIRLLGSYAANAYGDHNRAYQQFAKLARLAPNDATVHYSLSRAQYGQKQWGNSLASLRRATELDPANASFSGDLMRDLSSARRWDEAIAEQKRRVDLWPNDLSCQFELADLYFKSRGDTAPAEAFFTRLSPPQAQSRDMILARKAWDFQTGAIDHYLLLDRTMPEHPDLAAIDGSPIQSVYAMISAFVFLAKNDRAGAEARLGELLSKLRGKLIREPKNAPAWSDVSMLEALIGDRNEALRCGNRAVELRPGAPVWELNFAIAKAWIGEKDAALADLAHILRVPNSNLFSQGPLNVHQLRASPLFAPLKSDPRFEALLNDPKNNEPLF